MKITEISVFPVNGNSRLRAYVNIIFDDIFIIKDIKILESGNSKLFVVMPDKKITDNCPECKKPCPLVDEFCGGCGYRIGAVNREEDKQPLHEDVCHPINNQFRLDLQRDVIEAYLQEIDERNKVHLVKGKV